MEIIYLSVTFNIILLFLVLYLYKELNNSKDQIKNLNPNLAKYSNALMTLSAAVVTYMENERKFNDFYSRSANYFFNLCIRLDDIVKPKNKTVATFSDLYFKEYSNHTEIKNALLLLASQCTEKVPGSMTSVITRFKNNKLLTYEVSLDYGNTFLFSVKFKNENGDEVSSDKLTINDLICLIYELDKTHIINAFKQTIPSEVFLSRTKDIYNHMLRNYAEEKNSN